MEEMLDAVVKTSKRKFGFRLFHLCRFLHTDRHVGFTFQMERVLQLYHGNQQDPSALG